MGAGGWTCTRKASGLVARTRDAADALAQGAEVMGLRSSFFSRSAAGVGGGRGAGLPGWPDGAGTRPKRSRHGRTAAGSHSGGRPSSRTPHSPRIHRLKSHRAA